MYMEKNVEDRIWNTLEDIIEGADTEELSDDRTSNYEYSNSVIWNVWLSSSSTDREFYILKPLYGDLRRSVADDDTRFCYEAGDGFLWRQYTPWY